jgi:hypothetical protein
MDEIELFPIPSDKTFRDSEEFLDFLKRYYDPAKVSHPLTVVVGLTELDRPSLLASLHRYGFETVQAFGEVVRLKANIEAGGVLECYVVLNTESGVLYFFTNFRKTEEIPKISEFLQSEPDSYYLFFSSVLIEKAIEKVDSQFAGVSIPDFTARRSLDSKVPARYRPYVKRTVSYWAEDGKEVLSEMKYAYGVLVQRAIIEVPERCKFGIDGRGFMTFLSGSLECPLNILTEIIEQARKARSAYATSSYRTATVGSPDAPLRIGVSSPATISLSEPLAYDRIGDFIERLESEGFLVVDSVAEEGSLFFSSNIMTPSGNRSRIKSDGSRIRMFPDDERNLQSFMQFYEFVINQIDPNARLEA